MILALVAMMVATVSAACASNAKATDCTAATPVCSVTTATQGGASASVGTCSTKAICDLAKTAVKAPTKVTCSAGTTASPTKGCMVGTKCTGGAASVTMSAMAVIAAVFAFMK